MLPQEIDSIFLGNRFSRSNPFPSHAHCVRPIMIHWKRWERTIHMPQTRSTDGSERREWHGIGYQFPLSQLSSGEGKELTEILLTTVTRWITLSQETDGNRNTPLKDSHYAYRTSNLISISILSQSTQPPSPSVQGLIVWIIFSVPWLRLRDSYSYLIFFSDRSSRRRGGNDHETESDERNKDSHSISTTIIFLRLVVVWSPASDWKTSESWPDHPPTDRWEKWFVGYIKGIKNLFWVNISFQNPQLQVDQQPTCGNSEAPEEGMMIRPAASAPVRRGPRVKHERSEEGKIDRRDGFSVFLPSRPHSLPFRPWMSREASERGPEVMEEGRAPRNRKIKGTKARLLAHSLPSFTGAERSEVEVGGAVMKVPLAPPVPCSLASGTIEVAYASLISVSTERSGVGTEGPT